MVELSNLSYSACVPIKRMIRPLRYHDFINPFIQGVDSTGMRLYEII